MKKFLFIVFMIIFVSGCSTTHIGRNDAGYWKYACKMGSENCRFSFSDFDLSYGLKQMGERAYKIVGEVKMSRKSIAGAYKEVTRQKIVIAFMDEASVVYQKDFYIQGNIDDANSFNEEFEIETPFSFSVPVAYSYRIWEGSF